MEGLLLGLFEELKLRFVEGYLGAKLGVALLNWVAEDEGVEVRSSVMVGWVGAGKNVEDELGKYNGFSFELSGILKLRPLWSSAPVVASVVVVVELDP